MSNYENIVKKSQLEKGGGSKMIEVKILPNHTKEYMKGYCDAMDKVKSNDFIKVTSRMTS